MFFQGSVRPQYPTEPFGTNSITVRDTSVSSGRPQYPIPDNYVRVFRGPLPYPSGSRTAPIPYRILLRYGSVWFGMNSKPVPETSVSWVGPQYWYPTVRQVRYGLNTGTRHLGKFAIPTKYTPDTGIPYQTSPLLNGRRDKLNSGCVAVSWLSLLLLMLL